MAMLKPGTKVNLVVMRDGKRKPFTIKLGKRPPRDELSGALEPETTEELGFAVQDLTDEWAERYGYEGENRHMVKCFLEGRRPSETFDDGVNVTELLMTAYMSAEREETISFPPPDIESFVPAVARGDWNPAKD